MLLQIKVKIKKIIPRGQYYLQFYSLFREIKFNPESHS